MRAFFITAQFGMGINSHQNKGIKYIDLTILKIPSGLSVSSVPQILQIQKKCASIKYYFIQL